MWVEGWAPAWPGETWVVWVRHDNPRAPIITRSCLRVTGQPDGFVDQVWARRQELGVPGNVVGFGPPAPEHDAWAREFWRAGLFVGKCLVAAPVARAARIARELHRTARTRDGATVPGLVFHRDAIDVHAALVDASEVPDSGPVAALAYALSGVPEPVANRPADPVEVGREVFGRVAFPAGVKPPGGDDGDDGGLYGDPDW